MAPHKKLLHPQAAALYQSGLTLVEVCALVGMSPPTLRRRLIELGVHIRSPQEKTPTHRARISAGKRMKVPEFDPAGRSCREIAEDLGFPEEVIRERMVERGIARLPGKARPTHNYFWAGGRIVDKNGYVLVKVNNHEFATAAGYVREHRLVMEVLEWRYLEPEEVVDHISGVVDDNRPENLRLFPYNAEHLRVTLSGIPKQSRRRRQYPEGGPNGVLGWAPSALETGAQESLEQHPLWPFVQS